MVDYQPLSEQPPLILAIDLGTSGPKVALVSISGELVASTSQPTQLRVLPGGGAEQDPEDWWRSITEAARRLWRSGHNPSRVVAIGTTAQWAGTVAVGRDGTPLHPAIIWMDTRGARYIPALVGGAVRVQGYGARKLARWIRRTGGIPSLGGKEPLSHLQWLRHERPEVYTGAHMFLEPKDWLIHRLTGRFIATYDSIALHWVTDNRNIDRIDYDQALLVAAQLDRARLPDLVAATDVVGSVTPRAAQDLGVTTLTRVIGGTPDVHSAAVGSGGIADFDPHLYIGTSSWLSCHVPSKKTDIFRNMASLPSALPKRYLLANSQETAGACVAWLRDAVLWPRDALDTPAAPPDALARIDALAHDVTPGSGGVLFGPWLFGERCPITDSTLRSSFTNVSLSTTRAQLCRAVLEGVAFNGRWLLGCAEHFVGRRLDTIRMIGGGANSALWCQIHADILDREIAQIADPVQANARGVALLAAIGIGVLTPTDIDALVPTSARYCPRSSLRRRYDELFRGFEELVRTSRPLHARLHNIDTAGDGGTHAPRS